MDRSGYLAKPPPPHVTFPATRAPFYMHPTISRIKYISPAKTKLTTYSDTMTLRGRI